MKKKLLLLVLFSTMTLPLLTGCGSVSNAGVSQPAPSPTPSTPSPSPAPTPVVSAASRFIYGIQTFESSIGYAGGQISSSTGQITSVGAPFNDSGLGQNIVIQLIADPQGRFLYALNLGASAGGGLIGTPGIAELQINRQTGALARVPGSPIMFASRRLSTLAIDKSGHFLYQPNAGVFDIYTIDQSTGLLTKTASSSTAASIGDFTAVSPDGRFLFNASDTMVEALSIDTAGNLTVASPPVLTGGSAIGAAGQLAVSLDNKFLYVLNQGNVAIFNIGSTGTLTPVIGSPFTTDQGGRGFALTPDGKRLYVAFQPSGSNFIKGFTFDSMANTLTPIGGAVISDNASTVTVDGSGKFAFITEAGQLSSFSIDPASGALTRVSQTAQPISEDPQSMVVVP
ncbi:MAG TPA: beta-propeller fold lactonase family protein [Candidatus Acidoferrum sp.]|nr:beta-propeller fold lactonase family protein [Candidatus Acidoferrum sp.]